MLLKVSYTPTLSYIGITLNYYSMYSGRILHLICLTSTISMVDKTHPIPLSNIWSYSSIWKKLHPLIFCMWDTMDLFDLRSWKEDGQAEGK